MCRTIFLFVWLLSAEIKRKMHNWAEFFNLYIFFTDQPNAEPDNKVQKHVTFEENDDESAADGKGAKTVRNFFMMENSMQEQKANFMVGGDLEETEEKDEFPTQQNSTIIKQLSDAALMDKRRRLRWVREKEKKLSTGKHTKWKYSKNFESERNEFKRKVAVLCIFV